MVLPVCLERFSFIQPRYCTAHPLQPTYLSLKCPIAISPDNMLLTDQSKFFYPANLPIMSLLETLHRKKHDTKPQLKVFYWAFALIFVWEVMPEYIMPILTAVNVFCLAKRNNSESLTPFRPVVTLS